MPPKKKPHGKRRVGRPRKRRAVRRRAPQSGGQLGALLPLAKFVAPLVAGELAKFGIQKGLRKLAGKGHGSGLRLAGAGRGRKRMPQKRRVTGVRKRRVRILPMPMPHLMLK